MTVSSQISQVEYASDGVTVSFPIPFYFLENTHIQVVINDAAGNIYPVVINVDYTVAGAGNQAGGSLLFSVAQPSGRDITIMRSVPATQLTDYQPNDDFPAETHERALDKLTMLVQQTFGLLDRALLRPLGKEYFDAEGRLISNVQDPVSDQDAATMRWSREYLTALIAQIQGPINNANNIFYVGPDGLNYVVQDMSGINGAKLHGYRTPLNTVYDKLSESISAKDKGAAVAASDNTAEINAAIVEAGNRGRIYLADSYKVTNPLALVMTNGPKFYGPGEILTPAQVPADGFRQVNTYADENIVGIGREYTHRCYQYLNLGQGNPAGTLKTFLYGDSTVIGGNGETANYNPKALMERMFLNKGIGNVTVTNRGIGASMISAHIAQAVADLASNPGLYVLKSFINEGGLPLATRLADTETMLENWLSAVRSAPNGSQGALAIVVMGPNSTNDTTNRRDAFWYEQIRGMIIAKCRKWGAAYFDTYQMMQDTLQASTVLMMDAPIPGRPLNSVHPLDAMNAQIWGGMLNFILPDHALINYRSNNFSNTGGVSGSALAAAAPSQYPIGSTWKRATTASGWPEDGMVITERSVDSIAIQRLIPFSANHTRELVRTASTATDSWNVFSGVLSPLTFNNGWVDYDPTGAAIVSSGAMITADGIVFVQFAAKNGVIAATTVMATLPVGMRPVSPQSFSCRLSTGAQGLVGVLPSGAIVAISAVDATLTHALSMSFRAL